MGAAGVGSLPELEQEIGVGCRLSLLRVESTFDAAGERDSTFSVGFSLSR